MPIPTFQHKVRRSSIIKADYDIEFLGMYPVLGPATTYDFQIRTGRPHLTREIFAAVLCRNDLSSARTIVSGYLHGSGSRQQVEVYNNQSTGGTTCTAVRFDAPDGGQNALMSLTMNGSAADHCTVGIFRVAGRARRGNGNTDFSGNGAGFGTSLTANACTVNAGGFLFGIGGHSNSNPNTITNADQLDDIDTATGGKTTVFWRRIDSVSITPSITMSWSGSTGSVMGAWSFDG